MTGLINPAFGLTSLDSVLHLSEELPSPRRNTPKAILATCIIGFCTGFPFIIIIAFFMGDVETILNGATRFPALEILRVTVRNDSAAVVLGVWFALAGVVDTWAVVQTMSRLVYALARDRAVPWGGR